jgi:hypothetical protein
MIVERLRHSLHLPEFTYRACSGIEKVKFVKGPRKLIALLCDLQVSKLQCSLCQLVEVVFLFKLLCSFECHMNISTGNSQVESLSYIFLKEQSDL